MSGREPIEPLDPREDAPIVSDQGAWGAIPHTFDEFGPAAGMRDLAYTAAGILLVAALAGWLAVLSLSQATSNEVAQPALERAIVALTEIDGLLDVHEAELEQQVATDPSVTLPGYPLEVSIRSSAVTNASGGLDRELLRSELVARSVPLLQEQGLEAFRDPDGALTSPSRFSSAGLMDQIVDNLSADHHNRWSGYVTPVGLLALLLAIALLVLGVGFSRLVRLGAVMIIVAAIVLIPALLIRVGIGYVGDDDLIGDEARSIVRTLAGTPIRNAIVLAIGGAAIAVPALVLDHLFAGSERRAASNDALPAE